MAPATQEQQGRRAPGRQAVTTIEALPLELISTILQCLPVPKLGYLPSDQPQTMCLRDRLAAGSVSKRWRAACQELDWHVTLTFEGACPQEHLNSFASWALSKRLVELWLFAPAEALLSPLSLVELRHVRSLKSLRLDLKLPVIWGSLAVLGALTKLKLDISAMVYEDEKTLLETVYQEARQSLGKGVVPLTGLMALDITAMSHFHGYLYICCGSLPRYNMAWLSQLTQLTGLSAFSVCMTPAVWALPNLRELEVCSYVRNYGLSLPVTTVGEHLTKAVLRGVIISGSLQCLSGLVELTCWCCELSGGAESLAPLTKLRILNLRVYPLLSVVLSSANALGTLRSLKLCNQRVPDEVVVPALATFTQLECLSLSSCSLHAAEAIRELPRLKLLILKEEDYTALPQELLEQLSEKGCVIRGVDLSELCLP